VPLAIICVILIISIPAVIFAWFKLRSRNLAPLLDANAWAVNARAKINIPFGKSLTSLAKLPPGAERTKADPYAEKRFPWGLFFFLVLVVLAVLLGLVYYLYFR